MSTSRSISGKMTSRISFDSPALENIITGRAVCMVKHCGPTREILLCQNGVVSLVVCGGHFGIGEVQNPLQLASLPEF